MILTHGTTIRRDLQFGLYVECEFQVEVELHDDGTIEETGKRTIDAVYCWTAYDEIVLVDEDELTEWFTPIVNDLEFDYNDYALRDRIDETASDMVTGS